MAEGLACPKCPGTMERVSISNVEVDRCTMCRGIWFDADEFVEVKKIRGSESIDDGSPFIGTMKDNKQNISCPICKVPMVSFDPPNMQRDFKIERCPQCSGMFFDAGEFADFTLDQSFWDSLT